MRCKTSIYLLLILLLISCNHSENKNRPKDSKIVLKPHESPSWEATLTYHPSFVSLGNKFRYKYRFNNKNIEVYRFELISLDKQKSMYYCDSTLTISDIDSIYNCFSRIINQDFFQDSLKESRTIVFDGDYMSLSLYINTVSKSTGACSSELINDTNVVRLLQMVKKRIPQDYDFGFDKVLSFRTN